MNILKFEYGQQLYSFNQDGWFNATEAAKRFGQNAYEWLRLASTARYIKALGKALGFEPGKSRFKLVHASRISGLWGKHKAALALESGVQA